MEHHRRCAQSVGAQAAEPRVLRLAEDVSHGVARARHHGRRLAEITDPDPGVLDAELAALGGSVTRRAARDVYAVLQGR